eukprot:TRINITY_DN12111_c0_g2_i1.p1 TRINITY_DN12111_c0_g2~~TRINITY_DN12111_c0_g2_i1.p1  ORF type:complete len:234 (-),score=60.31 TRINITY_DN12111_c0_g2_i1:1033-1641(-)
MPKASHAGAQAQAQPSTGESTGPCKTDLPCCYLIINHISKKHNVRKLLGGAAAFGARVVVVGQPTYDFPERHAVTRFHALSDACNWLHARGIAVVGVEIADDARSVEEEPFDGAGCGGGGGVAFLMGNEGSGMSAKQKRACDSFVVIPQYGGGTASLNVTVAANIVMHRFSVWQERRRQCEPVQDPQPAQDPQCTCCHSGGS